MSSPVLYDTRVSHARTVPLRNAFTYRGYQWLVDLDDVPRPSWFAAFHGRDHLGDPALTLRQNLDAYLAAHDVDLQGGRILMLTNARVLGYVFNPLTVYWCFRGTGELECVVAEVHNTYGQRHCYLLRTDERGRADVGKAFYVSPFYPVDGEYRMALPVPGDTLALTITLHRADGPPFVAKVRGRRTARGPLHALTRPPLLVSAQIRWQGIRLFLRRLPVVPRPSHRPQEKVQ